RADAADAGYQRALESLGVVRFAKRLEVSDEESHHRVACGRPGAAHLIGQVERPQRLLERSSHRGRAAQEDREVDEPQVGKQTVEAFDLPGAEERLVEGIALV